MASQVWFNGHLSRLTAQIRDGCPAEEVAALEAADAAEAAELAAMHTQPLTPAELDLPGAHLHLITGQAVSSLIPIRVMATKLQTTSHVSQSQEGMQLLCLTWRLVGCKARDPPFFLPSSPCPSAGVPPPAKL